MGEKGSLLRSSALTPGAALPALSRGRWLRWIWAGLTLLSAAHTLRARTRRRTNRNLRAVQQLIEAVDRNHFVRSDPLHGRHRSIRSSRSNRPDRSCLVALDHISK